MDDDKAVTAIFVSVLPVEYTLTAGVVGNGTVGLNPAGGIYDDGTPVTLSPAADLGWTFNGWSGPDAGDLVDNGDGTWSITMAADKAVTANFVEVPPEQYTLTVGVVGNGTVGLNPAGGIYDDGTAVILTPTAELGWTFNGWSGPDAADLVDNGDGTWSIAMDTDKAVTANFVEVVPEQYMLTAGVVGNGTVGLNPAGGIYDDGTLVVLTPAADPDWVFDGWSGPDVGDLVDNGDGTWSITMDADKNVTAIFLPEVPPVGVCEDLESGFTLGQKSAHMRTGLTVVTGRS